LKPVALTVEGIATRIHEKTGRWPTSFQEVIEASRAEERGVIISPNEEFAYQATFSERNGDLIITYKGKDYMVTRRTWKEDGRYRSSDIPSK
jgi:hypothetical protein